MENSKRITQEATSTLTESISVIAGTKYGQTNTLGIIRPAKSEYPYVTTVLKHGEDNSWYHRWVERIGEEEAKRITKESAKRGRAMHKIIELKYSKQPFDEEKLPDSRLAHRMFRSLVPILDQFTIFGLEVPLWSHNLRISGKADCLGIYEDTLTVFDFKSALREKDEFQIQSHFLQCTYYAMFLYEMIGISFPKVAVVIAVEEGDSQLFVRETSRYVKEAYDRARAYHWNITYSPS